VVNELARKKMNLSKFGFGLMRRRVASAANRLSSISEEGVATVPLVGWQNPADAQWRGDGGARTSLGGGQFPTLLSRAEPTRVKIL